MKKYNLINNIFGWLSFAIAAVVYCLTIEPSASFWDCGEFISTAYRLEVGHPPGAPFFMLTGKFFSLFASDPSQVAAMINIMSALLSATTILFLFWTITHLAKKLVHPDKEKEMSLSQLIVIIGSGLVGALAYTFSDTFWFSAVEGEVYAYSSMFTALVFWLILKWENRADEPGSDKWLVLIAYTMGLSIGVHLLNLLCIPAIALVYYFKKKDNPNLKGTLLALLGSFGLIVVLMYGIIPGFSKVGGWFELFFVNTLGFSYNTGALVYLILLLSSLVWALYESFAKKGNLTRAKIGFGICMVLGGVVFIGSNGLLWLLLIAGLFIVLFQYKGISFRMVNTALLCLMVILIGYFSFALIPIRSSANPPMNQNAPKDAFSLASYLNREQYGDSPLIYGRTYASETVKENGRPKETNVKKKYAQAVKKSANEKDRYIEIGTTSDYEYTNSMLFPRMHASKDQGGFDRFMRGYNNWGGVTNPNVPPTFFENIKFFFSYQLNYMYWRYFMWNFSGRQNDLQGAGGITNGNWITGISFIDEHVLGLGSQDNLPPDIADNKGHNAFYMLPLILGILGIAFQLTRGIKGKQQFWVTFLLFFMTGLAIVIYLNQKPYEPRERDYAFAGSFYAFAIWIGFGVAGLWTLLKKYLPELPTAIVATFACLLVPIQMVTQTWDDHDRSGRFVMRDAAKNYLDCIEKDGIIFTNGDNDTFPLWYIQDVEGYRTDVRVCNLSYLQTDWYVDQMKCQAWESKPLPITFGRDKYAGTNGNYVFVLSNKFIENIIQEQAGGKGSGLTAQVQNIDFSKYYDMSVFKDTISLNTTINSIRTAEGNYIPFNPLVQDISIIPGAKLALDIDSTKVDWANLGTKPTSRIVLDIPKDGLAAYRNEIALLDMLNSINNDNWKRPIYFATTVDPEMYLGLQPYFMLQGLAFRIVPGERPNRDGVDTEKTFDNMVNKFRYTGINDPKVYMDETNMRTCKTYRLMFAQLIVALMEEGENDKALIALNKCMEAIPASTIPMGSESIIFGDVYYDLGQKEKAEKVLNQISDRANKTLTWLNALGSKEMRYSAEEIKTQINVLLMIASTNLKNKNNEAYKANIEKLISYAPIYYSNGISIYQSDGSTVKFGDYVLANLAGTAMSNLDQMEVDNAAQKEFEKSTLSSILGAMQKMNPDLYRQYSSYLLQSKSQPQAEK